MALDESSYSSWNGLMLKLQSSSQTPTPTLVKFHQMLLLVNLVRDVQQWDLAYGGEVGGGGGGLPKPCRPRSMRNSHVDMHGPGEFMPLMRAVMHRPKTRMVSQT